MPTPNDVRLLEAYLDGSLDQESRIALEQRLTTEPELRRDLAAERELRAHLGTTDPRADLLTKLDDIMRAPQPPPPAAWYTRPRAWLLLVALAGALGWYLIRSMATPTPLPPPTEMRPVIEKPDEEPPEPPAAVDTIPQRTTTDPPRVVPPVIRPVVPERRAPDPAIAAAYLPNDRLESRITTQYRGGEIDVFPVGTVDLLNSTTDEVVSFQLAGQVKTALPGAEIALVVSVINNRKDSYESGSYLLERPLPLVPALERNTLRYELPLHVQLRPGLYYVLIRDTDTEEVLSVQRLRVE